MMTEYGALFLGGIECSLFQKCKITENARNSAILEIPHLLFCFYLFTQALMLMVSFIFIKKGTKYLSRKNNDVRIILNLCLAAKEEEIAKLDLLHL